MAGRDPSHRDKVRRRKVEKMSYSEVERGLEVRPLVTSRGGWITLTVPHSDHYMDDCLVEAHIRRRTLENHRADLCAIFDFPATRENEFKISLNNRRIGVAKIHADLGSDDALNCKGKQFVFVPIGEIAQDTEQRWQIGVWSIVRLIELNCCPHRIANGSELFPANDGIIKVRPIIGDGELEPSFVAGRFRKRFVAGYRIHEMIEAASEGINAICNDEGPFMERRRFVDPYDDCISGAVSVHLLKDAVRISFHPGRNFIADGLSMFRAVS